MKTSADMSARAQRMKWRETMNPLRGLDVNRARLLCECYNRGEFADLMWTFAAPFVGIESCDSTLSALITRRVSAVCEMEWDIRIRKGFDKNPIAVRQAEALRSAWESVDNVREALEHLVMASFRGFAHLERLPNELRVVDQWNVARRGMRGPWKYNPGAESVPYDSLPDSFVMDPAFFIVRECKRPINRIALDKFLCASMSDSDWDDFISRYGLPSGVVIGPQQIPNGQEAEFKAAAQAISEGNPGYLPNGSTYQPNTESRGVQPFSARLEWLNQKLVLAGTGGLLTMLSQSGSGTLAGSAHMETFRQIARAEAMDISEELNAQFDVPVLREAGLLAPGARPLAWFQLSANERSDAGTVVDHAAKLKAAGLDVDPGQITDLSGYKVRPAAPTSAPFLANRETSESGADPVSALLARAAASVLDGSVPFQEALKAAEKALSSLPALASSLDVKSLEDNLYSAMLKAASTAGKGSGQ